MLRWLQFTLMASLVVISASAGYADGGFIDTPDQCFIVEKVEGVNVYLKAAGKCDGVPGRAYLKDIVDKVNVYVDGKFWRQEEGTHLSMQDVSTTLAKTSEAAKTLTLFANRHEESMKEVAANFHEFYKSPDFQQRLSDETQRLKREVFSEQLKHYEEFKTTKEKPPARKLRQDERVYLFVSSSMPMMTIRNYMASVARLNDPNVIVVMRGFVEGMNKIGPTLAFTFRSLRVNPSCENQCEMYKVNFVIDPLLFRRYAINRVPSVVYATGVTPALPEDSDGAAGTKVSLYHVVYGDASLGYILGKIQRETASVSLEGLLSRR